MSRPNVRWPQRSASAGVPIAATPMTSASPTPTSSDAAERARAPAERRRLARRPTSRSRGARCGRRRDLQRLELVEHVKTRAVSRHRLTALLDPVLVEIAEELPGCCEITNPGRVEADDPCAGRIDRDEIRSHRDHADRHALFP